MDPVIDVLAPSEVDCLERLWGQLLVHHSREAAHLAALGAVRSPVMKISVIAGNDGALRFYQREGAVDFVKTLVMPVSG